LILCGVFVQEWSQATGGHTVRLADRVPESGQVISALANLTERQAPEAYYEVMKDLAAIQQEAETLRLLLENATSTTKFSPQVEAIDTLSLADIKQFLASTFDHLLSKSTKRSAMRQQLIDRKVGLETALLQYERSKDKLDIRVSTSAAAAIISMKVTPPRLNPIIQNVMKGIKVGQIFC
jgi:TATA-binding protein-associated factor